jgi:hypothetical protein
MLATTLALILLAGPAVSETASGSETAVLARTASAPVCGGDCDGSGAVVINELLGMVRIALGLADTAACTAGDANRDGAIAIHEILAAVVNALDGCALSIDRQGCLDSGGTVTTASCCADTPQFPDTCTVGSCGCAPEHSVAVDLCSCAAADCFDRAQHACVPRPCELAAITKGPWVTRIDDRHATVFWESRQPGCVQIAVTPEAGGEARTAPGQANAATVTAGWDIMFPDYPPDETGVFYLNEVELADLAPGTCYTYEIDAPAAAAGRLCTTRPPGEPIRFLAIGDTNPALGQTAPLLAAVLTGWQPDFVVHTGDIQYYSSVLESWQYWFGVMAPMLRAGAFLPCIGNHENELDGAEFADYYARLFPSPGLIGTPLYYRFSSGGVHFFSLDTEAPRDVESEQYHWFAREVAAVTAEPGFRFSVVYLHRPLYTLGDADPLLELRALLAPLFEANGVRLVLQGHMHGYERFEVGDITYVTTAGGGALLGDVNENVAKYPDDAPLRLTAARSANALQVTIGDTLRAVAIDPTGTIIDQFEHEVP